jgi:hypothetical protein
MSVLAGWHGNFVATDTAFLKVDLKIPGFHWE